jgi:multidrug efflux pump
MLLSDISVKRPVFAAVLSLVLIVLGVLSADRLQVREYPDTDAAVVSVTTAYRGASAATVETRITQRIEDQVSGVEGIRWLSSASSDGLSRVTIEFNLTRDIEDAANDVRDRVSRILNILPDEADTPRVAKVDSDEFPIVWFNLNSETMSVLELTDYADRYIVDTLSAVDGVARVQIGGAQHYAMRIWLNRIALAARNLTVSDVEQALRRENIELPAGSLESTSRDFTLRVERSYRTAEDFESMVIAKMDDGHLVRLGEVAEVEFGAEEPRIFFHGNGLPQIGLGIVKQSTANTLDVARSARATLLRMEEDFPEGMSVHYSYDSSVFIEESINQVYTTLGIAIALVIMVIYMFLGTARATLIPAVTVPVSLIASFLFLYIFGYTINTLTLLALVLSIGLVVDDAIVVLENIYRRIQRGEAPLVAAYKGARQVGFAVIATTLVLVAVFMPIIFLEGNTGRLFGELAVAVAGAVTISTFVALSLCPMLSSKILAPAKEKKPPVQAVVDRVFEKFASVYERILTAALKVPYMAIVGVLACFAVIGFLFDRTPSELTPSEDRGAFFIRVIAPEGSGFDYTKRQLKAVEERLLPLIDEGVARRVLIRAPASFNSVNNFDTGFGIIVLHHWDQREESTNQVIARKRAELAQIPGANTWLIPRQGLGGASTRPLQFVIGAGTYEQLSKYRDILIAKARQNPGLVGVDADFKETKPQMEVEIDRNRAADLGISIEEIGRTLETMIGSREVTTFNWDGEEYDVRLQARRADRQEPSDLSNLYVRSSTNGDLVPLSNLVTLREFADAQQLNRYNRMRSVTISAGLAPDYSLGEALAYMEQLVDEELPASVQTDYRGQSLEFKETGQAIYFTFVLALLVVFLVLAAQFESFIHPIVIMASVPLALLGALFGLTLFEGTLNIYSQVGIIILVGIAAKNGILIVEFANQLRDAGRTVAEATVEAARIRLRPIVMTGLSTMFGAMPLVLSDGAGAETRGTIGTVIVSGVLIATGLTLIVVPVLYRMLAPYTRSPHAVERELNALQDAQV